MMRGSFSTLLLALLAMGLGCGSEGTGSDLFECNEQAIDNGRSVTCERFGTSSPAYTCLPPGNVAVRTLPATNEGASGICPLGTVPKASASTNDSMGPLDPRNADDETSS